MSRIGYRIAFILLVLAVFPAMNGHRVRSGDLDVFIEEIGEASALDEPIPVRVTLKNHGRTPISGLLRVDDLVDETRLVGDGSKSFLLQAGQSELLEFAIAFGKGAHSALYPVHAYVDFEQDGESRVAHAVRIVSTRFPQSISSTRPPLDFRAVAVPSGGAVPLWTLSTHRVAWRYYDGPIHYEPVGWRGSVSLSRASMDVAKATRGATRSALAMHPPWTQGGGTIYCDYSLSLPALDEKCEAIRLTFFQAIRDHVPEREPPSDGVLFRVWAGPLDEKPELLHELFTDSKSWTPGQVDLSRFAGKTILLRLESHPGPNKNTTCDASFWGEPIVEAGPREPPPPLDFKKIAERNQAQGHLLLAESARPDGETTFLIGRGEKRVAAILSPSRQGIVDGILTLVGASSSVSFRGFQIEVLGAPVISRGYKVRQEANRAVYTHELEMDGEPFDLTLRLWVEGDCLRVALDCPKRITDFSIGQADQTAPAIYYGHGYRIVNPGTFRASFGGHDLSSSHMGADYAQGMSLLQAIDVPPDFIEVDPAARRYAIHGHLDGTLTLVPGQDGALDCAVRYRPYYDKKPSGGVERLAGRFCFDVWGGRYAENADRMREMIRYGLTDAFLTLHVWQRWGYDYRLPDIWPPDPKLGSTDDLRHLGDLCRENNILWGLHDNYIDIYPDAAEYSYDHIAFTPAGEPIKAWYNEGRDAQSYRWRPDRFMPYLQRNVKQIKAGVDPTHYFMDVLTSIGCFDFYDREGKFHPSTETREKWGESFAWIRDHLGDNAPTTSEAGHDQLIGYLDGADCQFLALSEEPGRFLLHRPCETWQRVPWYDAVNHHRFALHGVGYPSRYMGGLDKDAHGIQSDDYLSAEILTGHNLMVDRDSLGRGAVRKYWLAQDVSRNLALKKIESVEMFPEPGGAPRDGGRLLVRWNNGTRVHVNRGPRAWDVSGSVLPQYGFLVEGQGLRSSIETRDGIIGESAVGPGGWYCNARAPHFPGTLPIRVGVENFRDLGDGRFRWDVVWKADSPTPRDLSAFVHFYGDAPVSPDRICFQDDHRPSPATNRWDGTARYSRTIAAPKNATGDYEVGFGLWSPQSPRDGRMRLMGRQVPKTDGNAYWAGTLSIRKSKEGRTKISLRPPPPDATSSARFNQQKKPIDFSFALTDGAFRVQKTNAGLRLTPLPDSPVFRVTLRTQAFGLSDSNMGKAHKIIARDKEERALGEVDFEEQNSQTTFAHDGKAFCYDIEIR